MILTFKENNMTNEPALQYEIRASDELELIATDYHDIEDIYQKIIEYAELVKQLEDYVNNKG
jgi:hypothetical protein